MTLLVAAGLRGGYDGRDVVHGVDLEVRERSCTAVLGPNGAGKSTLLRLLAGVLPGTGGTVELLGRPLASWRRREIARTLALVPQQVQLAFPLTVREVVEQGRAPHLGPWRPPGPHDHEAVATALTRVGLAGAGGRPVQRLSGGERQRVLLARALATEARLLLLDEPAAGLDVRHQLAFVETLRDLQADGVASVVVLHDWNLALQLADQVLVLRGGSSYASGTPAAVLTETLFRQVFGVEVEIVRPTTGAPVIVARRQA